LGDEKLTEPMAKNSWYIYYTNKQKTNSLSG